MTLMTQIIPSQQPATASVIWLHGIGASADDFIPMLPNLHLTQAQSIRFVFPNAPLRPVTIAGGMSMPAWYDVLGFSTQAPEDLPGLQVSQLAIEKLIEQEIIQGIAPERIVLGGFSQGGALTLFAGLQSRYRLGGLAVMSAYLPCADYLLDHASAASFQTPIFMAHGEQDPLVKYDWALLSKDKMVANGHSLEWHSFPIAHEASLEELAALSVFINKVLTPL